MRGRICVNGCCCWRNLSTAATAAGVFTAVTSLIQILLQTAVFTGGVEQPDGQPINIFNTSATGGTFSAEQTVYILYVALAGADLILAVLSIIMLFGVEPEKKPSRLFYIPWLAFLPLYMIYESAINVYFFYMAFSARLENRDAFILRPYGFLIVPLFYWFVKEIINFVFWVAVIGRVREIDEMRTHGNAPLQPGPTTVTAQRPGAAAAFPAAARAPGTFYQAPPRRDFFQETATRPDYGRPGLPRRVADYGGGHLGPRPYVSKYTVPPRY